MIGTPDLGHARGVRAQASSPMTTRVVVALDPAVFGPHDDERIRPELVDDDVSGLRDLLFATSELPDARPQELDLSTMNFCTNINPRIDGAFVCGIRIVLTEVAWRQYLIPTDDILVTQAIHRIHHG